ncbi:MAG: ECF transporter S component [Corallococcus sp.]|nr:ECF transporter S component [Corallococcus sp.]
MDKRLLTISEIIDESVQAPQQDSSSKAPKSISWRTVTTFVIYLIVIPAVIFVGVKLFEDRKYNIISIIIAFLACVPFFIGFERGKAGARELVVIAVLTAMSVVGRLFFAPIPGFKPVTAIVIITGINCGMQAGFITGALSAIVSNIFFGQGPWTPFQMFVWGFIGLLAGLIGLRGKKPHWWTLVVIGVVGGVLFSMLMDIWTVLNIDGTWNWSRYFAALSSSLPFMAVYAVSNVVFLLLLTNPFWEKLNRIKTKYGIFG